jgi:DNA modification methylase
MKVLNQANGENWTLWNADCIEVVNSLPENSLHLSIFSPPYASLYTYSNSDRDMGNSANDGQFYEHFDYMVAGLHRATMPGRIVCVDVMNIPAMKERDGYIGLKDFRGDIIRAFQKAGFIFHSEHCAWKDPLIEATRTKALGLMHKQLCKDSTRSRSGIPQYLLAFRKDGENPEPVAHNNGLEYFIGENEPTHGTLSHERWRRYASPVWMDINFSNTLNAKAAREAEDERHVCPMALDLIERAVQLWSNPGDVIFDPYSGVGSTGYVAVKAGRKFVGSELKTAYFTQAAKNIGSARSSHGSLFDEIAA